MKFSLLLVLRQYRRNPLRSAFLYGGMLCAVCLICGTMFGMESLNHCVIVSADSVAAPLIHRAAQLVTLLVAFFTGLLLKNGFLITLEQRMQMLGRLYALGMSHRQMRRMVVLEALIGIGGAFLCAVPLSVFILWCVFQKLNAIPVILERFGPLQVWVQPSALLFCLLCCLVAAFVAIRKPLQIVKRVTPIALLQDTATASGNRCTKVPKPWKLHRSFVLQYAARGVRQRWGKFRPLAAGITACVLLVMACHAFTSGVMLLYNQQDATYAYRVYLQSDNDSVPEPLWKSLAEIVPGTDALLVEEINISVDGGLFRLLILEDDDFASWYGQPLTTQAGTLPFVRADAVSDGVREPPVSVGGSVLTLAGRWKEPLPLHIGRIPGEENVTIGVTNRTAFTNAVVTPAQIRSLIVYYDTTDGESVTPRLRAVLDKAGCNYTVQDYTPTSEWARQRQAIGLLMQAVRICFPFGVLLLGGLEIFSVIYAQILARRREFALLRSAGIRSVELYGIAFTECALCLLRGVSLGMLSGVVMLIAIANILQQFWFDLFSGNVMLICVACFAAMGTLAVLSAVGTIRRFPVAYELRHE